MRFLNKKYLVVSISLAFSPSCVLAQANPELSVESKTDSGALTANNSGYSIAHAISADGKVIVGGANTDSGINQAFAFFQENRKMTSLGTLKADSSGYSYAHAVSADGKVIVGRAATDSGTEQAFAFYQGNNKMTSLGTLKADDSGYSSAFAVSADGKVIVGYADTDRGPHQAFALYPGRSKMTGLGTLKVDDSGSSSAFAVSADGKVIVGRADTDNGTDQAFAFYQGNNKMTSLGTLKADDSGNSSANAISADGKVIAGYANTDSGSYQAFAFYQGNSKMTGLGTLKADNSGYSIARAVSADGKVIVGGANTDSGINQAFAFYQGNSKMTGLGTLKADNSGHSIARAVSADGKVIVGRADTDNGTYQAFAFSQGNSKMTGLGTLKADNSGNSSANAVSADGTVVVGKSQTDTGDTHAAVWKLKGVESDIDPAVVIVDATNTHKAMMATSDRGFKVLDLYQSALNNLDSSRCQLGQGDHCMGVFSQFDFVNSNNRMATGLFGALRLPSENWSVGVAINMANHTRLIDNYNTSGSNNLGAGLFTRYQQNRDSQGLSVELSGSLISQGLAITRAQFANTEAGKGKSRVKGHQARLSASYGIKLNEQTLVSPVAAIIHRHIVRDGYTENHDAEFAATYGRMGNRRTDLQLGLTGQRQLTEIVQIDGGLGANVKLNSHRDAFTSQIDYIGEYSYRSKKERGLLPYAFVGLSVSPTVNSTVRTMAAWQQTDYRNNAVQVGLNYSYRW